LRWVEPLIERTGLCQHDAIAATATTMAVIEAVKDSD